jgi:ubiquinone/menaquinone biosynthesis C-methylase UbiE
MARNVRLREMLVGIEGLALLRHMYDGTDEAVEQRLSEIRELLDDEAISSAEPTKEADPRTGYRSWSESYDEPGNQIVALEQPTMWALIESLPPGKALDAACGTGRHARHLVDLGHEVLGIDLTQEMLSLATANVPEARFVEADLRAIPAEDRHFDLVVCGLALAHLPDLDAVATELARVLKHKGRLMASVIHPFQAHLGWHARFADSRGHRAFIREHAHTHADYMSAFRSAGLRVLRCVEPELTAEHVRGKRRAVRRIPEATMAAYVGLPGVLVWDVERA